MTDYIEAEPEAEGESWPMQEPVHFNLVHVQGSRKFITRGSSLAVQSVAADNLIGADVEPVTTASKPLVVTKVAYGALVVRPKGQVRGWTKTMKVTNLRLR